MRRLLLGLEVVEEDAAFLRLLAPVTHNDAGAVDDLAGVALTIDLAYSMISPNSPPIFFPVPTYTIQPTRPAASHPGP